MVLLRALQGTFIPNATTASLLTKKQRALQDPVVSCELGKLYNKDAIVEYLIDKTTYGDGATICGHVKSLKVSINPLY